MTYQDLLLYNPLLPTATVPDLSRAAQLFHALSDETRLAILDLLRSGERCVCDLQVDLDAAQSRLSFHLKVLRDAGVVTDRKEGRWSYYAIVPESLAVVHDTLIALRPSVNGLRRAWPANARCCG